MIWRILGKILYASSLIVTLPILGLGVIVLISMPGWFDLSIASLVFGGLVVGGVLGVAGLILNAIGHSRQSRSYFVTTVCCLITGTLTCAGIAFALLWNLDATSIAPPFAVPYLVPPFAVLATVGIVKTVALLRKVETYKESATTSSGGPLPIPASSIEQSDRSSSDPVPVFLLGLACVLATVVLAMHLMHVGSLSLSLRMLSI